MYYIHTNNPEEQWQLQRQFSLKNGHYMVQQKYSSLIVQLLTKITHEYFHNKIPIVVQKLKDMMVRTLSSTYSLTQYRETMQILKKQHENMQTYREHLIAMNRAFAEDEAELFAQNDSNEEGDQDIIFEEAMKGQTYQYSSLQQLFELPFASQIKIKEESDTNTEKTVKSDLQWTQFATKDSEAISGFGTAKLENFFAATQELDFGSWKTSRNNENGQETSRQMKSFEKKKSTIFLANPDIQQVVQKEMKYDLSREITLGSGIMEGYESPRTFNHQRRIRDNLINIRLKMRRK